MVNIITFRNVHIFNKSICGSFLYLMIIFCFLSQLLLSVSWRDWEESHQYHDRQQSRLDCCCFSKLCHNSTIAILPSSYLQKVSHSLFHLIFSNTQHGLGFPRQPEHPKMLLVLCNSHAESNGDLNPQSF